MKKRIHSHFNPLAALQLSDALYRKKTKRSPSYLSSPPPRVTFSSTCLFSQPARGKEDQRRALKIIFNYSAKDTLESLLSSASLLVCTSVLSPSLPLLARVHRPPQADDNNDCDHPFHQAHQWHVRLILLRNVTCH